jgi:16S rRNA (cytidine1402-2'-O)-methyltransferase
MGVLVEVIPGASAVTTAVALSGIAAAGFTFLGFLPRRDGRAMALLSAHRELRPALVLYESPRRLARLLALAADSLGAEREAAVCLELTKKFQRVIRGAVGDLAERFASGETKGEAVVVLSGAGRDAGEDDGESPLTKE